MSLRIYYIASYLSSMQEDILQKAKKFGHQHLVDHYNSIKDKGLAQNFLNQLKCIDFEQMNQLYADVYLQSKKNENTEKVMQFAPLKNVFSLADIQKNEAQFNQIGYESISKGEASVCIMSGGQGTRLGFDHPKGMYNLKLQSNYTLFEYFARKLLRLNEIVKEKYPESKYTTKNMIKWYMMTSELNNEEIISYFKSNDYFGYDPDSIVFFPQGWIPALDYNGKVMIEDEGVLACAAVGNGAIYLEMKNKGVLKHMKDNGVKYVYVAPVDNILLKLGDPKGLGYMIKNNFEIVSTYMKKSYAEQKVGLHVSVNGKVQICEYSEVPKATMQLKDQKGELIYCHGNRATMFMSTQFIERITTDPVVIAKNNKKYHLAEKKIKSYDQETKKSEKPDKNNGMKFELFYFDVFEETDRFGLYETLREDEFAPIKNAEGNDSPATARDLVWNLNKRWLKNAGIETEGEGSFEIDPRLCYDGEKVKQLIHKQYGEGKVKLPAFIH